MLSDENKQMIDEMLKTKGFAFSKGQWRRISNHTAMATEQLIDKFASDFGLMAKMMKSSVIEIKEYMDNAVDAANNKQAEMMTPQEAVAQFIRDVVMKKFKVNPSFTCIESRGERVNTSSSLDEILAELSTWQFNNCKDIPVGVLNNELKNYARNAYTRVADTVGKAIEYDPACVEKGDDVLNAMYQGFKIGERYDIFIMLFKHWMWQVKRKLYSKDVKWHIWLNFRGPGGIGKSETIEAMCKPIFDDLYDRTDVGKLFEDTKEIKRLSSKYILNFDEIAVGQSISNLQDNARLTENQKATLKSILTGKEMNARVYGSQTINKHRITFSCISSSNDHLYDVVYDPATMRRYFEFNSKIPSKDHPDTQKLFEILNEKVFPFALELWKSIDENREDGYWDQDSDTSVEISKIQSMYYPSNTSVAKWMRDVHLEITNKPTPSPIDKKFEEYLEWCKATSTKNKNKSNFVDELKARYRYMGDKLYFTVSGGETKDEADLADAFLKAGGKLKGIDFKNIGIKK